MLDLPVYLDHAATTPTDPAVLQEMLPYFTERFGNPSTIYAAGAVAREAVDEAREVIAEAINADPEEIYFTSGGTESNNWAVKGMAQSAPDGKRHLLTTPIEHHSVLDPAQTLHRYGYELETIRVDSCGLVEPDDVRRRIRSDTILVSVMHANNEVGTIEPIAEIGAVCQERGVPFHVDAVQTFGKLPIDVRRMGIDLLTLSGHKLYGPKGIGALYIRRGQKIAAFFEGGEQERGKRAGTLNVAGIVGFSVATRLALSQRETENCRLIALRDRLIESVLTRIPDVRLSGPTRLRLPNNAHFCFPGVEGESLLLSLDMAGVYASAGSACTTGSVEPSHVLLAMGIPVETARGALRLTLGRSTTEEAVDYTVDRLCEIVHELRSLS
jgi:cysteine desulfurase